MLNKVMSAVINIVCVLHLFTKEGNTEWDNVG